jgi:DNA-binding SARP family transcriptional activator
MSGRVAPQVPRNGVRQLRLFLIDGFAARCLYRSVEFPPCTRRLLACLALAERPLSRAYIAGQLWPDIRGDHADACLRSALWRLRQVGYPLVVASRRELALSERVTVDYREAKALAEQLVSPVSELDLSSIDYRPLCGNLLPDWEEEWLLLERESFRQLRLLALESLCTRLSAVGLWAKAILVGRAAVDGDPLDEMGHQSLIRAYVAAGDISQAARQYDAYRHVLQQELDLEPSVSFKELVEV